MLGAAIELKIDCPRCSGAIHVNALVTEIECASCHESHEISVERWRHLLTEVWDEIPDYARGRGGRTKAFQGEHPASNLLYARFPPYCFDCKTDFEMSDVVAAHAETAGSVECSGCKKPWHVRPASGDIGKAFPQLSHILCEDETLLDVNSGDAPSGAKPIIFQCPSCQAPLKVDGTDRAPHCEFCKADVFLPDALWRRLHPVSQLQRWFLWWDEGDRSRDPKRYPADADDNTVSDDASENLLALEPAQAPPAPLLQALSESSRAPDATGGRSLLLGAVIVLIAVGALFGVLLLQ